MIVQPVYPLFCVPPGQIVVLILSAPPDAVTVTFAVAVFDPAAFVAVSVYVVVAPGLTLVDPLAEADVNDPGVMATLVAFTVVQLNWLLPPAVMLAGFAVNELITGSTDACTVTAVVAVTEPAAFVAVSVYVVVADGLTLAEPLADADVIDPGEIATDVAPVVTQLSVLLPPALIPVGLALNEVIVGIFGLFTVIVAVAVTVPVLLVAVNVYVVVAAGLSASDPSTDIAEKLPGAMLTLVASVVVQLSVVLVPAVIAPGVAPNALIVGAGSFAIVAVGVVHPDNPPHTTSSNIRPQMNTCPGKLRC